MLSAAVLDRPLVDPRRDPRWMQVRQFAVNDLQRVISLDDKIWEAHLLMGRLQALPMGDAKTAKRELTQVIDASDATPDDRAQALALRGTLQTDEAKRGADFDEAIKLLPDKPDYYRVRAQYRYGQDKYDEALVDIDKALELEPDHPATIELRGLILLGLKKYDEALAAFSKASELAPEAVLPHQHLGEVYRQQGNLEKSAEQLTKALELEPNDPATLLLRANVYNQLGDPDAALKDVDAAIKAQPQLLVAHLLQAEILASENRIDEAIANLEKLLPLAPNQARLLEPLATFYLVGGYPRKSIETFTKILDPGAGKLPGAAVPRRREFEHRQARGSRGRLRRGAQAQRRGRRAIEQLCLGAGHFAGRQGPRRQTIDRAGHEGGRPLVLQHAPHSQHARRSLRRDWRFRECQEVVH